MRLFTARGLAFAALFPALIVLSVVPGCSNQGEGERCEGDEDCASNLTCKTALLNTSDMTGRCCYADRVTDTRCTPVSAQGAGGGTAGSSTSTAGSTSSAGTTSAGTSSSTGGEPTGEAGASAQDPVLTAGAGGA